MALKLLIHIKMIYSYGNENIDDDANEANVHAADDDVDCNRQNCRALSISVQLSCVHKAILISIRQISWMIFFPSFYCN